MNCDPLARWYRWLEYAGFGRALERRRLAYLPRVARARKVLLLGEGDGRFLAGFLRANPSAEVDCVDSSARMLALARARAKRTEDILDENSSRVHFHHEDAECWLRSGPPRGYDLICTHFFLDCFTQAQLETLVGEIGRHATGHACWIVSEFRYPPGGPAAWAAHAFVGLLYGFFRMFTGLRVRQLPDHGSALQNIGFRRKEQTLAAGGLLVSEHWESASARETASGAGRF